MRTVELDDGRVIATIDENNELVELSDWNGNDLMHTHWVATVCDQEGCK